MNRELGTWIVLAMALSAGACGGDDDSTCTDCDADVSSETDGPADADAEADADGPADEAAESGEPCTGAAECDDGLFCNGVETCSGGFCAAGVAPEPDDGVECTVDSCDETADAVVNDPDDAACSALDVDPSCDVDGQVVRVAGVCDPVEGCVATTETVDDCTDPTAYPVTLSCSGLSLMRESGACVPGSATSPAQCVLQSALDTDCGDPAPAFRCSGSAATGDLAFLSDPLCDASGGSAACGQVSTPCTASPDACAAGSLTTSVAFCDPGTGCDELPTTAACSTTPNHCEGTTYVTYTPQCADGSTCGAGVEARRVCPPPASTCEGQVYTQWASQCAATSGCGAVVAAATDCTAMSSRRCVGGLSSEATTCTCDAAAGCTCSVSTTSCLRLVRPSCSSSTTIRSCGGSCNSTTGACETTCTDTPCPSSPPPATGACCSDPFPSITGHCC
jgi:hypothetical protein